MLFIAKYSDQNCSYAGSPGILHQKASSNEAVGIDSQKIMHIILSKHILFGMQV